MSLFCSHLSSATCRSSVILAVSLVGPRFKYRSGDGCFWQRCCVLFSARQENAAIIPRIWPQPFPFASSTIRYSLIVIRFNFIKYKLLTPSLNNSLGSCKWEVMVVVSILLLCIKIKITRQPDLTAIVKLISLKSFPEEANATGMVFHSYLRDWLWYFDHNRMMPAVLLKNNSERPLQS